MDLGGKQVHQPVLGYSPWVELPGPYKRSLHHSAVIVVTIIDLLWSLRFLEIQERCLTTSIHIRIHIHIRTSIRISITISARSPAIHLQ
ncbi:hypothetical protein R6Z07F_000889 [Ovis aries]